MKKLLKTLEKPLKKTLIQSLLNKWWIILIAVVILTALLDQSLNAEIKKVTENVYTINSADVKYFYELKKENELLKGVDYVERRWIFSGGYIFNNSAFVSVGYLI